MTNNCKKCQKSTASSCKEHNVMGSVISQEIVIKANCPSCRLVNTSESLMMPIARIDTKDILIIFQCPDCKTITSKSYNLTP